MSTIKITLEEAKRDFPAAFAEIVTKMQKRKGKKVAGSKPEDYKWSITWCTRVKCTPIGSLMIKEPEKSAQERTDECLANSFFNLEATFFGFISAKLATPPAQAVKLITEGYIKEEQERKRFETLPEAEKQKEINALLGQLRGSPGFMEVRLPFKKPFKKPFITSITKKV